MAHIVSTRSKLSNVRVRTNTQGKDTYWCLVLTVFKLFLVWLIQTHIPSSVPCTVMLTQIIFRKVCQQGLREFQTKIVFQEAWRKRLKLSRTLNVPKMRFFFWASFYRSDMWESEKWNKSTGLYFTIQVSVASCTFSAFAYAYVSAALLLVVSNWL